MQRMLVTVAVIALVFSALAVGTLAAHWPFWQRAWQWQSAEEGWPDRLGGPELTLQAAATPLPLDVTTDERLASSIDVTNTSLVLVGNVSGQVSSWTAPGFDPDSVIDGRGLAGGLLAPLLGAMELGPHGDLLDVPLVRALPDWRGSARAGITPRLLLWQLSGLASGTFSPLNPFNRRAQLASGPDFDRAAMHTPLAWPPGSHFEPSPANPQLLALFIAAMDGGSYGDALQRRLWSRLAAAPATGMLDHRRGQLAAHCCLRAAALDWLRLGLLLAADGMAGNLRLLPEGYVSRMADSSPVHPEYGLGYRVAGSADGRMLILETSGRWLGVAPQRGRALLWVGQGDPPKSLETLLSRAVPGAGDSGPMD